MKKEEEKRSGGVEGTVVCRREGFVELAPGSLPQDQMARACGLWRSFFAHECSVCGVTDRFRACFMELDQGDRGLMKRVVCEVCLPGVFERRGQRAEGGENEGLLTSSPTREMEVAA